MSDDDTVDWRRLREFTDVDLGASYVLSWHVDGASLFVDVDVFLTPRHPFYEEPRPAEKVCIRPAVIEFPYCEKLGRGAKLTSEVTDIAAEIPHGAIAGLRRLSNGHYEITGEFGTVMIDAERPILRLKEP